MTDCKECERLKAELAQAKAENSVLRGDLSKWAAACEASRLGLVLPLPPLVEALHKELERLRSLTASGAGDCAGG